MLLTTGSMEIAEWIAHMRLTSQEESDAIEKARHSGPQTLGG